MAAAPECDDAPGPEQGCPQVIFRRHPPSRFPSCEQTMVPRVNWFDEPPLEVGTEVWLPIWPLPQPGPKKFGGWAERLRIRNVAMLEDGPRYEIPFEGDREFDRPALPPEFWHPREVFRLTREDCEAGIRKSGRVMSWWERWSWKLYWREPRWMRRLRWRLRRKSSTPTG